MNKNSKIKRYHLTSRFCWISIKEKAVSFEIQVKSQCQSKEENQGKRQSRRTVIMCFCLIARVSECHQCAQRRLHIVSNIGLPANVSSNEKQHGLGWRHGSETPVHPDSAGNHEELRMVFHVWLCTQTLLETARS